jgi:hypothetical protein
VWLDLDHRTKRVWVVPRPRRPLLQPRHLSARVALSVPFTNQLIHFRLFGIILHSSDQGSDPFVLLSIEKHVIDGRWGPVLGPPHSRHLASLDYLENVG